MLKPLAACGYIPLFVGLALGHVADVNGSSGNVAQDYVRPFRLQSFGYNFSNTRPTILPDSYTAGNAAVAGLECPLCVDSPGFLRFRASLPPFGGNLVWTSPNGRFQFSSGLGGVDAWRPDYLASRMGQRSRSWNDNWLLQGSAGPRLALVASIGSGLGAWAATSRIWAIAVSSEPTGCIGTHFPAASIGSSNTEPLHPLCALVTCSHQSLQNAPELTAILTAPVKGKLLMKRTRLVLPLLLLCFAILANAADVAGKWTASFQTPDGQDRQIVFDFKVDGDKVTGTADGPMGQSPITDGKLTGDSITFTVDAHDMKIVHKGTVSGDEMKLKVDMGDQVMDMTAKRASS